MAPYQYLPLNEDLDEIRTLTLHPGDFSADIHISIQKVVLTTDNPPIYEALSYAWGSTEDPVDVRIGSSGNERLAVTQNLAVALPYLRYEDKVRTLWIDAICINQQDLGERSRQVKRMADIYSLADRVIVWLGPEKDNSAKIIHLLSDLSSEIKVDYATDTITPATLVSAVHSSDRDSFLPYSIDVLWSIDALINRPWFSRLWVWQEIRLARNNPIVICGTETIPWASLRQAISCLASKRWDESYYPQMPVAFSIRLGVILKISGSMGDILQGSMIRELAVCKCSDPRDYIYAVQSLLPRSEAKLKIKPDYTKVTAQVYQDLMVLYINSGKLDLLKYCELKNDGPTEMPSWVPNWADKDTAAYFGNLGTASGDIKAVARYQGDGVLSAAGVIFATVTFVREMTVQHTYQSVADMIHRIAPREIEHLSYVTGGSLIDAFCRTLACNVFCDELHPPNANYAKFKESRELVLAFVLYKSGKLAASEDNKKFLNTIGQFCSKRSFILTSGSYIGIAPRATKPGDLVCIFLGCRIPLVLRKASGLQYQIVGECYVHGVMNGEAFLGPIPNNYKPFIYRDQDENEFWLAFIDRETGNIRYNDPRIGVDEQMEQLEQKLKEGKACIHPDGSVCVELTPDFLKRRGVNVQTFDLI